MSGRAVPRENHDVPAESGLRSIHGFLDVNLDSHRIPKETRASVQSAAARGRVEVLDDGTAFIRDGETLLGTALTSSEVFSQLRDVGDHHVVIIFGIGTGQLPRLVRSMCRCPVVIYEPDPAVLRTLLEFGPLDMGDMPVVCNLPDLTSVWREFAVRQVDVRVLTTPGYYKAYPEQVAAFVEAIPILLERTAISKATFKNRGRAWIEDIIANVELLADAPPFLTLEGHYTGVPAFIIGAGPSLDKNIELLADAAKRGIVFATNSGAVALAQRGIEPQVVCCIESIDASSKLRDLFFMSRVVRAFSLSAHPDTLRTGTGPLLPVHEAVAQFSGPLTELTGCAGLPMSSSVSTVATSLARFLGCSPIVLVGQDLAYSGGLTYATGTGYEASRAEIDDGTGVIRLKWNEEALRVHGEAQGPQRTAEELRRVPAWGGQGEVDSGAGFTGVHTWFEATAELLRKAGAGPRLINATEGGVHIQGFEDVRLRDVLAELPERAISASDIAAQARAEWTPIGLPRIVTWLSEHAAAAGAVRRAARRIRRFAQLAQKVTAGGDPSAVTRVYDRLERAEARMRRAVARGPLVDAWAHRAIDAALASPWQGAAEAIEGPRRAAQEATHKSANVASAVEQSARELESALTHKANELGKQRTWP